MIAKTVKNGDAVRLSADYQIEVGMAYYYVNCHGVTMEFRDFATAANVYKNISKRIEEGTEIESILRRLVEAARLLGHTVREVR